MKKLLYILITLLVIAVIGYFILLNLPKASSKNKDASFKIEAADLYNEFQANEVLANKKYSEKTIEISGSIMDLEIDKQGASVLYIDADAGINGLMCTMEMNQKAEFEVGQKVVLKGLCSGYLQGLVVLNKCVLIKE